MNWSEIPFHPTPKSLRQFAVAWLFFFLAFGVHQYLARGRHELGLTLGVLAVVIGLLGLSRPATVRWLYVGWMVLAFPIGWVISQVALALMFYGIITPIAVFFRIRGRDLLCRKPAPEGTSYWTPKETPQDVRSYFRQY
ncbi:MAG: SxtJ family membrane protein [Verrucomicrobiota bacterium]|jgi:hypothetical protein